jgi:hypothetical protein
MYTAMWLMLHVSVAPTQVRVAHRCQAVKAGYVAVVTMNANPRVELLLSHSKATSTK